MIKNKKGISLVEVIVASGIVATTALVIGYMVKQNSNLIKSSQSEQYSPGVTTDVINKARAVLLTTKNEATGRRSEGICSLLYPQEYKPGIYPVNLLVPNTSGILNNSQSPAIYKKLTWEKSLAPDWKVSKFVAEAGGNLIITLEPADTKTLAGAGDSIDLTTLRVQLEVGLRVVSPEAKTIFEKLSADIASVDAKRIMYLIQSTTTYSRKIESGVKEQSNIAKDVVSVIDVGACDVVAPDGTVLTLSPAGTGVGDPAGKTIYNNTVFADKGVAAFEITMAATEVIQGRYLNGRLSADRTKNVVAACAETRFQCKNRSGLREFKPFINVTSNINYNARNAYGYRDRVRVMPELVLLDKNGQNMIARHGASVEYSNIGGISFGKHSDNLYYIKGQSGQLDLTNPMTFAEGGNRLVSTVNNVGPLCRAVCNVQAPQAVRPEVRLSTPDILTAKDTWLTESNAASMGLHCTMCFVKGCSRMGYETFGPVSEMPDEPLDAQIPECAAQEVAEVRAVLPVAPQKIDRAVTSSCVSGRFQDGKLVYKTRNCNEQLPVLCFAYGQYAFAQSLGVSGLAKGSYSESQTLCRRLGTEAQATTELRDGIAQQGGNVAELSSIPVVSGKYRFVNLAKQGIFTAPQSEEQEKKAQAELISRFGLSSSQQEFWVALHDTKFGVLSDIPKAYLDNDTDMQHAVYYNAVGVQTHTRITSTPYSFIKKPASSSETAGVLFNHVKYRGVVPADKNQEVPMEFLCRKTSTKDFYITSGKASDQFKDGGSACESTGGLFVAPQTSIAWLNALLDVEAHGNQLPFPEISNSPAKVWVALEGGDFKPSLQGSFALLGFKDPKQTDLSSSLVNKDGSYIENILLKKKVLIPPKPPSTTESVSSGTTGGTTTKQTSGSSAGSSAAPAPEEEPQYEWVDDDKVEIKLACFSEAHKRIIVRSQEAGCDAGEKQITDSDFSNPIVALLWVEQKGQFGLGYKEFIKVR